MEYYVIVNPGMEELAKQEIKELIGVNSTCEHQAIFFQAITEADVVQLILGSQSINQILAYIGDLDQVKKSKFNWNFFFQKGLTFKVEVINVKGQDNRLALARQLVPVVINEVSKNAGFSPEIKIKHPDISLNLYFTGRRHIVGLDLVGKELSGRDYRVFPHSASFKGDLAYFFVRKSGFKPGEKLLVGWMKDGTLPIEAAIYANRIFRDKEELAFSKFQWFKSSPNPLPSTGTKIYAFDENRQNVIAAQKNAIIAQVKDLVFISRYSLDELDVKYDQHQFDRLILQVTLKDEDKINEIYYQASYILKPKGTLLLIGRSKLDISISEKFKLIREEEISRGNSGYKILVLEKK
ncbi:MAG TPA: hypothetical protein VJC39_02690 [Candidatus Nanoarchaeia archaeon]|nr:hypothetical protein [Candidatus Nanoarchaeia archaeon]